MYRLAATKGITKGQPLKHYLSPDVALIAESLVPACAAAKVKFDRKAFEAKACAGLEALELKARSQLIADAMLAQLAAPGVPLAQTLAAFDNCLGPSGEEQRAAKAEVDGLGCFFFWPHSSLLDTIGRKSDEAVVVPAFDALLASNLALTKRFTAEFSIRALIERWPDRTLAAMTERLYRDPCFDVRRLVSEGTRPRLPWGLALPVFKKDPTPCFPLLDVLKWDTELYVRRSVANHVGDVLKDNFDTGLALLDRWTTVALDRTNAVAELERRAAGAPAPAILPLSAILPATGATKAGKKKKPAPASTSKAKSHSGDAHDAKAVTAVQEELLWVVRHALRNPDKNGNRKARLLREKARL